MKINTLLRALVLFIFSISLYAQEGANDPTFNPADVSIGTTVDGHVAGLLTQPDNKLIVYGNFEKYNDVDSHYIVRVNPDKSIDTTFSIGAALTGGSITDAALQSDGKIVIAGYFTQYNDIPLGNIVRLNSDGSLDSTFAGGIFDNTISSIKVQSDGKILIGGEFNTYNNVSVNSVIRLKTDGSLDSAFSLGYDFFSVTALAIQNDGKILVAGENVLKRFNANGTIDTSFADVIITYNRLYVIVLQEDGKIIIGGGFYTLNYENIQGIGRVNTDGTLDDTFDISTGINGSAYDIKLQPDGVLVCVGDFTSYNNFPVRNIVRIYEDGGVDESFHEPAYDTFPSGIVCVGVTANNIYIGGGFISYDTVPSGNLRALNYDGTLDYDNFEEPSGVNNPVNVIVDAGDGNMIIGGAFTKYNGQTRNRIALLNFDGQLLNDFNPGEGFNKQVKAIYKQGDGKYIVIGDFSRYQGVQRLNVARLNADGSLDTAYNVDNIQYVTVGGALQPDGKLILYGHFILAYTGSASSHYLACRINVDGSLDQSFRVPISNFYSSSSSLAVLQGFKLLPSGKMLISLDDNDLMPKIVCLNNDGTTDNSFPFIGVSQVNDNRGIIPDNNGKYIVSKRTYVYPGPNRVTYHKIDENGVFDSDFELISNELSTLSFIQGDGKMFFITNNGLTSSFKRFNIDGTLDETFGDHTIYEYYPSVNAVCYQEDKVVIGGRFSRYDSNHRSSLARFNSIGAALQTVTPEAVVKPSLITSKKNNILNVECSTVALSSVAVYDLSGRLVAKADELHDNTVSLKCSDTTDGLLIVTAKLQDGSTVVKKII